MVPTHTSYKGMGKHAPIYSAVYGQEAENRESYGIYHRHMTRLFKIDVTHLKGAEPRQVREYVRQEIMRRRRLKTIDLTFS